LDSALKAETPKNTPIAPDTAKKIKGAIAISVTPKSRKVVKGVSPRDRGQITTTENRPQVAQPLKYKSGIKIKTDRGDVKGDLYLLPSLESLDLIVAKPSGNASKGTKEGYAVYEKNTGKKLGAGYPARNRMDAEPLNDVLKRVSYQLQKNGGIKGLTKILSQYPKVNKP